MTRLADRITRLQADNAVALAAAQTIIEKAAEEDRDLDDTEQTAFDAAKDGIEANDKQVTRLRDAEVLIARSAVPVVVSQPAQPDLSVNDSVDLETRANPRVEMKSEEYPGATFTRYAIALALGKGVPSEAERIAKRRWPDQDRVTHLIRAATDPIDTAEAIGAGGGSALVTAQDAQAEFIDLLRPQLIVTQIPGMRRMAFGRNGSIVIPKMAAGVAGGYVGEGNSIPVERPNFDSLSLTPSKLSVIVPITNEMVRHSTPSMEQLIRDDMLAGCARTIDNAFLSDAAAGVNPAGILEGLTALAGGAIASGANVAAVTTALGAYLMSLRAANIPMVAPVWVMNTATAEYLRLQRGTTSDDFAWRDEMNSGTLLGYPVVSSTSVNNAVGAVQGDQYLALMDGNQIIWAEDMAPVIDFSNEAVVQSQTDPATPPDLALNQLNAWQQDLTLFRVRMAHSWGRRRDEGVVFGISSL